MARGRRINVIYSDNRSGLSRDAWVVRDALERAGHHVSLTPRPPRRFPFALNYAPELARTVLRDGAQRVIRAYAARTRRWDVNVFLERLVPEYFQCASVNCFFPNPEWLAESDAPLLNQVDLLLCKTRHALHLLRPRVRDAEYVGFTSVDRRSEDVAARPDTALHVCGWNPHKGTEAVVAAWAQHPEWPELTIVTQLSGPAAAPANVTQVTNRIADARLRRLQNACAVHVCPSEVEGFGHTLMEALSCGAILITTDAPPMDELVSADEGFLVPHVRTAPMGSGLRYIVDPRHLADMIARVWATDVSILRRVRRAARARFEASRTLFHQQFVRAIQGI